MNNSEGSAIGLNLTFVLDLKILAFSTLTHQQNSITILRALEHFLKEEKLVRAFQITSYLPLVGLSRAGDMPSSNGSLESTTD